MPTRDPHDWMWGDALDTLARDERLHRALLQLIGRFGADCICVVER